VIKGAEYKNADPGIDDLNDELKRAATDIHSGWSIITRGAAVTVSGKSPGAGDIGGKSAKLAEQYYWFVKELHRKHMGTWVFDDVVCNGLSRSECANKRRCYPAKVYDELVSGLQLYADTYPPL
jgi:hypothetical protein